MKPVDISALDSLVRPAVEGQGYDLVDIEWKREQAGWVFRVTIDRPPGMGRISHDDCASVSREVSALLDVHDALPGRYSLEISSPGLNRPLKREQDFARFVGEKVRVRIRGEAATGEPPRRNFVGRIDAVLPDLVRLSLEDSARTVELRISDVEKANLIYQFR